MAEKNSYEIAVNQQVYRFTSTDSEAHIRRMEQQINAVIEDLTRRGPGHKLSDYAIKVAIALADAAARSNGGVQEQDLIERFQPLLDELDSVI